MPCLPAWAEWVVILLQYTASLHGGSGQVNFRYTTPHCLWAMGTATPAMQRFFVWGQWAVPAREHQRGGTGSPAQAVVGVSRGGLRGTATPKAGAHQSWGTRGPPQAAVGAS